MNDDIASRWGPRIVDFISRSRRRQRRWPGSDASRPQPAEGRPFALPSPRARWCWCSWARSSSWWARRCRPLRRPGRHRRRGDRARVAFAHPAARHPFAPLARRTPRSSGNCGRRASCSGCSSAGCSRSPAAPTRASSATRSSIRTCSASRPAPGSARRSRSPTRSGAADVVGPAADRRLRGRGSAVALAYALGASARAPATRRRSCSPGVTVVSFLTAIQTFIQQQHAQSLQEVYSWILGSLDTAGWHDVVLVAALRRDLGGVSCCTGACSTCSASATRRRRRSG